MDNDPNTKLRLFSMIRNADESGKSGTGRVIDGALFPNGQVVVRWRTLTASLAIYQSFADFVAIHIDQHPTNRTEIVWHEVIEMLDGHGMPLPGAKIGYA